MLEKVCAICAKPTERSCSACNAVHYCSKEHQKRDWKTHKNQCAAAYAVERNVKLGRYLVAGRDIAEGEVIVKKRPLVCGPKAASHPVCLGCHKNLRGESRPCSKCKWPLCGKSCEESPYHKDECVVYAGSKYEPRVVVGNNSKQIAYAVVLPVRALLLKQSAKYKQLTEMQSNLNENANTPLYGFLRAQLVPIIKRLLKNTDETEILTICSIFDTNCFDIRDEHGLINIRGLYPTLSLIAHECRVNTRHAFTPGDHQGVLTATIPIKAGELIKTTYTQTLWPSLTRRAHLHRVKNFWCDCTRCADPTEFGLHSGSFCCPNCDDSSAKMLSAGPLDANADWVCEKCAHSLPCNYVVDFNAAVRKEMGGIGRENPGGFLALMERYQRVLHPTNSHIVEMKYAIVQIFGNVEGFRLYELSGEDLERKIRFCTELIGIADILEPGSSKFRLDLISEKTLAVEEQNKRMLMKVTLDVD